VTAPCLSASLSVTADHPRLVCTLEFGQTVVPEVRLEIHEHHPRRTSRLTSCMVRHAVAVQTDWQTGFLMDELACRVD
jgi:hypothetical protein